MVQFSYTGYYAIVLSTNHKTVNTKTDPWWHVNYNIRHQYLQYQHPPHHCSLDRYQSRDCWSAALCSVGLVGPLSLQNYTWKKKTIVCYSNDWLFTLSISVYWPHLFKSLFAFDSVEGERNLWSPVKNRIIISFTLYIYQHLPKDLEMTEWALLPSELTCFMEGDLERLVREGCLLVSELMKEVASSPSAVPIRDAL